MDSATTLVNKFNTLNTKPVMHIKEMEILTKYVITKANRVTTKYGTTIQVEVENHKMFLPNRYNILTDDDVEELNTGAFCVYREGERNLILTTFKETEFFGANGQFFYK